MSHPPPPTRPPSVARFVLPSALGVLFFLTPLPTSDGLNIGIGILVDWTETLLADALPWIVGATVCLSAAVSVFGIALRPAWWRRPSGAARPSWPRRRAS